MNALFSTVASALADHYEMIRRKVHELVDPISTEQLWRRPYSYGNSVGHLLLHLTGNLNYYIGGRIAATGYIRNRDREFTDAEQRPKEKVLADFDRAIAMVIGTVSKQSTEDWSSAYSAEREPEAKDRFSILLRCASHAYHHVGQMIYLCKEMTKTASATRDSFSSVSTKTA